MKTLRFSRISQKSAKKFKSNLKIFPFNPFTSLPSHSHKTASQSHFSLLFPSHFRYYFHIRKSSKIVSFQTKITFIHGVQHKFPIFKHKKTAGQAWSAVLKANILFSYLKLKSTSCHYANSLKSHFFLYWHERYSLKSIRIILYHVLSLIPPPSQGIPFLQDIFSFDLLSSIIKSSWKICKFASIIRTFCEHNYYT